jgi:glycosyltransferase involved in cell wall biosynthesis
MTLRFSIITATYNREKYLRRCIESVAQQPYADKEHVIVDGGSTDGTVDLLREYAARYPHLRWISEPDHGISDALNKGMALMTGAVFNVIGDDDFHEPDVFELVARTFHEHPEAGVIAGNCAVVRNDDSVAMVHRASFTSRRDLIAFWDHWERDVVLPAASTFVRRAVLDRVGGFDPADRYAMDYHHWIRITEHFSVHTIDRTLANFRYGEGTVSHTKAQPQFNETLAISRRYWGPPGSREYLEMFLSYQWFMLRRTLLRLRVVRRLRDRYRAAER